MKYKNTLIACFIVLGLITPNLLPIQASTTQLETTLTREQKILLIQQLLEQVKVLQTKLETLKKSEAVKESVITASDYTHGNANARVQILTYTDIDCPFCKMFHSTLDSVLEDNPSISVTYRHFPLEQLHPNAKTLAIASECAGVIGGDTAFFKVVDSMFDSRELNESTNMSKVSSFISKAGISLTAFNNCNRGDVAREAVEADYADGVARGVQGTPQSYLLKDGKIVGTIEGAQPLDVVQSFISDLLK
jgi:protein-disulfide isomerase